ncbi:MAG: arsenate reductase (glutaredoxin) [Myxococcota bacterium]
MSDVTIWHYNRCSKSRQTLALLEERDLDIEIREYLEDTPSADELDDVLTRLEMEPRAFMRTKESAYKENGLDDGSLSRAELIDAMIAHPKLIQRPVVIKGDEVALGRPPEAVLDIL